MPTKKLRRTKQCAKCPWKVSTNPHDIPNGYCELKHQKLEKTIARNYLEATPAMACHESKPGKEAHCIGWLVNQLGPGNNIMLRLQMREYDLSKVETVGEQHSRFEDTLP